MCNPVVNFYHGKYTVYGMKNNNTIAFFELEFKLKKLQFQKYFNIKCKIYSTRSTLIQKQS